MTKMTDLTMRNFEVMSVNFSVVGLCVTRNCAHGWTTELYNY